MRRSTLFMGDEAHTVFDAADEPDRSVMVGSVPATTVLTSDDGTVFEHFYRATMHLCMMQAAYRPEVLERRHRRS